MKKIILPIVALTMIALVGCKSPISLVEGNPEPIKNENIIEVQFTYDNMRVGNELEEAYVKRRIEDDGEEWHERWVGIRGDRFEPRFVEVLNRYTEEHGLKIERGRDDTKYIMMVNTHYTEPGFYTYVRNKPAEVGMTISLVERDNPDRIIAEYNITEIAGINAVPEVGTRIQSAYGQAARVLGRELRAVWN